MNERWTLTSRFNGRLNISGIPEPLGFGESRPWIGPLNEQINDFVGKKRLTVVRSIESTLPAPKPLAAPIESPKKSQPSSEPVAVVDDQPSSKKRP